MKYLLILLLLASCGPYRVERNEPHTKIYVDKIPPELIVWYDLKNRVYPTDDQLDQIQDRYIRKVVFFKEGNQRFFFNDNSTLDKRYIQSSRGPFDWKQNICVDGSGEALAYDIASSDDDNTEYSVLYIAKGTCQDQIVNCALIETQYDGDIVFELSDKGCDFYSFNYIID